jgi:hypothetical protein
MFDLGILNPLNWGKQPDAPTAQPHDDVFLSVQIACKSKNMADLTAITGNILTVDQSDPELKDILDVYTQAKGSFTADLNKWRKESGQQQNLDWYAKDLAEECMSFLKEFRGVENHGANLEKEKANECKLSSNVQYQKITELTQNPDFNGALETLANINANIAKNVASVGDQDFLEGKRDIIGSAGMESLSYTLKYLAAYAALKEYYPDNPDNSSSLSNSLKSYTIKPLVDAKLETIIDNLGAMAQFTVNAKQAYLGLIYHVEAVNRARIVQPAIASNNIAVATKLGSQEATNKISIDTAEFISQSADEQNAMFRTAIKTGKTLQTAFNKAIDSIKANKDLQKEYLKQANDSIPKAHKKYMDAVRELDQSAGTVYQIPSTSSHYTR